VAVFLVPLHNEQNLPVIVGLCVQVCGDGGGLALLKSLSKS